ncbi:MAG: hypothetical protein WC479_12470 [Candidatus Izemoplasmatales bacterium]
MSPRWLIGMALAFLILGVFANITDGMFMEDNQTSVLWEAISNFKDVNILNPMTYDSMYLGVTGLIDAVWQMFIWDYTFLNGYYDDLGVWHDSPYQFFRWILITISVGLFVAFMLELFRLVRGT